MVPWHAWTLFPAIRPVANAGEWPKSFRWEHAEALSESRGIRLEAGIGRHRGSAAFFAAVAGWILESVDKCL